MDTLEDNLERWAPLQAIRTAPTRGRVRPAMQTEPSFPCPGCALSFASEQALRQHLFAQHANGGFYLRVDNAVVPEVIFLASLPQKIDFIPLGTDPVALSVQMSDAEPVTGMIPAGSTLSVLKLLKLDQHVEGILTISGVRGGFRKTYQIHLKCPPALAFSRLNALVYEAQRPLLQGQPPRWERLQAAAASPDHNSLECRYLNGFAELLLSEKQELFEKQWGSAARGIGRAFGYLRIFPSNLARSASALLAFRMNAFRYLLDQGPGSTFWQAANFFQTPPCRPVMEDRPRPLSDGLWMDDYQETLLRTTAWQRKGTGSPQTSPFAP